MNSLIYRSLRIYGDNILECEKTLTLLINSISLYESVASIKLGDDCSLFCPKYNINTNLYIYGIQLFPGYKRWSSNILDELNRLGASLNEGTDSIVTIIDNSIESIILGCEYCGALPAGNNAWQRSGRALLFAEAKIPFFYYSEIGGIELDAKRVLKSGRLPNPLIPFSYITVNHNYCGSMIIPVYNQSPTISKNNLFLYKDCFSNYEDTHLIYCILVKNTIGSKFYQEKLIDKALNLTKILINNRTRSDSISSDKLSVFFSMIKLNKSYSFFESEKINWYKSININLTDTAKSLFQYCLTNCFSMGSNSMPFCMVPENSKKNFLNMLIDLYPSFSKKIDQLSKSSKPLALEWVTGFKPRGDDSRPDRGLLPLFKMLFGNEYDILTIVIGPMNIQQRKTLDLDPKSLSISNGLWRAIFTQSEYVIVDDYIALTSPSKKGSPIFLTKNDFYNDFSEGITYNKCIDTPNLGEHDIDTVIHSIFDTNFNDENYKIFECLCNPPGGDWSGIRIYDYRNNLFYRWSSLPRVSGEDKRPDHLIQFSNIFLVIESKFQAKTMEENIGYRLKNYVRKLFTTNPNSISDSLNLNWTTCENVQMDYTGCLLLSAAAYYLDNIDNIADILKKSNVDVIFAFTFNYYNTCLYISCKDTKIEKIISTLIHNNPNLLDFSANQLTINFI